MLRMAVLAMACFSTALAAQWVGEVLETEAGPVRVERLATLDVPWGMTFLPDGRLLITEKPGQLRIYSAGQLSSPIKGVPEVAYGGQGGLLDVEIDPDYARNKLVYLSYAEPEQGSKRFIRALKGGAVARGRLEGETLRDVKVIWRQTPKTTGDGHFGGRLVFAPDGKLFITSGERQKFDPAQAMDTNLGKVVRINPDGSIPNDNPFVKVQGAQPDIWSLGHRNPLGAAINPASRQLWIHEMGPRHGDEVNLPQPRRNFGWPIVSNGDHYSGIPIPDHPTRPEFAAPVHFWRPAVSPSGLIFYRGKLFPKWQGNALLGGLSGQALVRLALDGEKIAHEERIELDRRVRDVIEAPDGAVLLLTDENPGELLRLTPAR